MSHAVSISGQASVSKRVAFKPIVRVAALCLNKRKTRARQGVELQ